MRARWVVVACALALGACGVGEGDVLSGNEGSGSGSAVAGGARADLTAAVAAARCDRDVIGDETGKVESIYAVVDGELAGRCYGKATAVLVDAWLSLAATTRPEDRRLLGAFATFSSSDDTLAFTVPVDDSYERFAIAFNLRTSKGDTQELHLTTVHEFAHVLTQVPGQLDLSSNTDRCRVYWNGAGCFLPDSYIARWIDQFWSDADLRAQPADGSTDEELAEGRCSVNPKFLGAYAASSPEEDFAESFSAFVFDIDVPASVQPKRDWFARIPELAVYRDLRRASELPQAENSFDPCG